MKRALILVSMLTMLFVAGLASEPDYFIADCNGKPGGSLSIDGTDPLSLNPAFGMDGGSAITLDLITESLLNENEFGFPEHPALCKDWWISEDGFTLSFVIREGLQWSDGQPFTIEDVRWTFEEIYLVAEMTLFGNSNFMSSAGDLPLVEVEGNTISFTWSEPNALAPRTIGLTPILPKHCLEKNVTEGTFSTAWNIGEFEKVVVMGPFVVGKYYQGDMIVLERNPYYWKFDSSGFRLPYLDKIFITVSTNMEQVLIRFEAGELDIINPTADQFPRILSMAEEKGWKAVTGQPRPLSEFLMFNFNVPDPVKSEWFRNEHFRKAIAYAMDRKSVLDTVYCGLGVILHGPVSSSSIYYDPQVEEFSYDFSPTRARLELKRGGFDWRSDGTCIDEYGNPVSFQILTCSWNSQWIGIVTILSDQLSNIGINATTAFMDWDSFVTRAYLGTFDSMTMGEGSAEPGLLETVYHSKGTSHYWNFHPDYNPSDHITEDTYFYPDWQKRIDEILEAQKSVIELEERCRLFSEFQLIMAEHMPLIFMTTQLLLYAYDSDIHHGPWIYGAMLGMPWRPWDVWRE
ncbi:ABC-type dipeptide transport system, periplasmic component [Mesotoga prima MesG1.Ag.4.2]|uniref:ABC-type dipeptide transport system, periplasmic component n=1 Tax=Mesotoga prima MesG1.Ag.4.2 TaxID=660470 RepID=I2F3T2_9BACT|nr:ABC transporter substrate-binding protein [Mesotoga prima]AFK06585.1 ABC-type dipeptide transport system, periplasmic component [Mesotoga prima MesG1.Ag.4.2]